MEHEKTPERLTEQIVEICKGIVEGIKPQYVKVQPQPWCKKLDCYANVSTMVEKYGGKQVYGWTIWIWKYIMIDAEAHSVWQSPEGELIDVTPHEGNDERILYLIDNTMVYDGNIIGSRRFPLNDSPIVKELIDIANTNDKLLDELSNDDNIRNTEIKKEFYDNSLRSQNLLKALENKFKNINRNDPCPCGSGRKFKLCCGKE